MLSGGWQSTLMRRGSDSDDDSDVVGDVSRRDLRPSLGLGSADAIVVAALDT